MRWNVTSSFNYRDYALANENANENANEDENANASTDPAMHATLKAKFTTFHDASDRGFFRTLRQGLDTHAGRPVPLSGNNGGHWNDPRAPWDLMDFNLVEFGFDALW